MCDAQQKTSNCSYDSCSHLGLLQKIKRRNPGPSRRKGSVRLPTAPPLGGETLLEPSNYHSVRSSDCYKLQNPWNAARKEGSAAVSVCPLRGNNSGRPRYLIASGTMPRRLREEFDQAALPHLTELLRAATRMCGNRDAANDLVQETFLQAWRSFARFQPGTNCRAWLYKILIFSHSKQRRSLSRQPSMTDLDQAGEKAL